jgi:hypothetical protein
MLPFSTDQFLDVFRQYNQAIWPLQIVAYVLGLVAIGLAATPSRPSHQIISAILAGFWAWMGIVYHILFFRTINPAALGFGALFLVQALGWLFFGLVRPRLTFALDATPYTAAGLVMIVYAILIYPLIGAWLGHGYPQSPSFGVAPCPTTIFTFGLLLCTSARVPRTLLIIPALWALIGFAAALTLGIREDIGLLLAAGVAVPLLLWRDRTAAQAGGRQRYA